MMEQALQRRAFGAVSRMHHLVTRGQALATVDKQLDVWRAMKGPALEKLAAMPLTTLDAAGKAAFTEAIAETFDTTIQQLEAWRATVSGDTSEGSMTPDGSKK